mmetsp:Transcript_15028/g.42442  ORF Transcript_15028/g.42442 Transcript_15028/m.42442 type:complete len:268 (-) Transcript_15028:244-1047(-)
MGRKSKHANSGHLPLTHHERAEYSKGYGTQTQRLSVDAQYKFGNCVLSISPAEDQPVATPSGNVYERPAILEYLLVKTREVKKAQDNHEKYKARQAKATVDKDAEAKRAAVEAFEESQTKAISKKRKVEASNPLARTSYWLSEFQPETDQGNEQKTPPPERPPSPFSQNPLRRKDLVPIELKRNDAKQVLCSVSDKVISTQQAVALIPKSGNAAQVMLKSVYDDLGKEKTCPVTGEKVKKVLKLRKGGSSFAASGTVEAKVYTPTMT